MGRLTYLYKPENTGRKRSRPPSAGVPFATPS